MWTVDLKEPEPIADYKETSAIIYLKEVCTFTTMRKNTIWNYSFIFICCVLKSISSQDHGTHTVSVVSNRYNTQHQYKQNPNVASRHSSHESGHNSQPEHVTHIAASHAGSGGEHSTHLEQNLHRSSYNLLSEAMSQAVSNEFSKCHVNTILLVIGLYSPYQKQVITNTY